MDDFHDIHLKKIDDRFFICTCSSELFYQYHYLLGYLDSLHLFKFVCDAEYDCLIGFLNEAYDDKIKRFDDYEKIDF